MAGDDVFGWVGNTIDGRYAVERVIGEGGQGLVYRARHLGFEVPIAVKCLKIPLELETQRRAALLESFRAEARLLHRLSRKTAGIVQALDIGAATAPSGGWCPYIVMEWLEGESLAQHIDRRVAAGWGAARLGEAVQVLTPAAHALAIAHANGVSHLDVKPGNLFLCRDEHDISIKVLDFGIAKVLGGSASLTRALAHSGASLRLFTPAYAAPEQFNPRHGARGPWTDVFALALIVIELASGRSPLGTGDSNQLYVASADERHRPSLGVHGVSASHEVEQVILRAVAVEPERRFRHAGEMWTALEAAMGTTREPAGTTEQREQAARHTTVGLAPWPAAEVDGGLPHDLQPAISGAPTLPGERAAGQSGENRVCTVLIATMQGFEALHAHLDPEQVQDLIDHCVDSLSDCIESLGGSVERSVGDTLLAVFGLERATDSDAERAVHAALDMRRMLAGFSLPHRALADFRPEMRAGIATGRVFVGRGTRRSTKSPSVAGETVTLATKLSSNAAAGEVRIARDTHRLVGGLFDCERAPALEDGARVEPLPSFRVTAVSPGRAAIAIGDFHGVPSALVGRAPEMAQLAELFETAVGEPCARIVTLVGNPGVGRSRVLAEVAAVIGERAVTLYAQGSALTSDRAYGSLAALLRGALHIHEDDPLDVLESKLRSGVRRLRKQRQSILHARALATTAGMEAAALSIDEIVELLTRVLDTSRRARGTQARVEDSIMPDEAGGKTKQRIAAAVSSLLRSVERPVAIYCDDAHWMDDATLDLLDDLAVRMSDTPLYAVVTARPTLYERRPLWGEGKEAHVRLDVGPLSRRHIEQLVRQRLARVSELSDELVRRLVDGAEGSPLTLDEMLHLLVDAGAIEVVAEDGWRLHPERLGGLALPTTVQGIVQARLDRLPERERDVLMRAAVVGRTFWDGALVELGVGSREAVAAELGQLRSRRLLQARDTSQFPDEHEYVFAEAATQQVAYEALSLKVRWRMHRLIAAWLEQRTGKSAGALVAHHHELAGNPGRAARCFVDAASHAAELGQNGEALRLYERAARIDETTAGGFTATGPRRITSPPLGLATSEDARVLDWRERVQLQLGLGDVERRMGRLDDAERRYHDARTRLVKRERRGDATVDPAEIARWEARAAFRLGLVKQLRGAFEEARALTEKAIELAREAGASDDIGAMWALLAALLSRQQKLEEAKRATLTGLRACRAVSARDERWHSTVSELLIALGAMSYKRGRLVAAERCFLQASRIDERRDPHQVSRALNNVAAVRFQRGDVAGAEAMFRRVLELTERTGDLAMTMTALSNMAEIEHRLGHHDVARDYALSAIRLGHEVGAPADLADMYRNLAEATCALEAYDEAADAAERALTAAQGEGAGVYLPAVVTTAARVVSRLFHANPERAGKVACEVNRILDAHSSAPELAAVAPECRQLLAQKN
jgi:class 3 adenylate cyclase/tetratricopeptide (TPR) repeat protein